MTRRSLHPASLLLLWILSCAGFLIACGGDGGPTDPGDPGDAPLDLLALSWVNRLPQGDNLLAGDAFANTRMLVGDGGAVVVRREAGGAWERFQAPTRRTLSDVVLLSETHAIAVGADGILESRDQGKTWKYRLRDEEAAIRMVDARNKTVIAAGNGIFVSVDQGESYKVFDAAPGRSARSVAFLDEDHLVMVNALREIWHSTRPFNAWNSDGTSVQGSPFAMEFPTPFRGTLLTRNPDRAYFSSDGGDTWTVAQEFPAPVTGLQFFDGARGLTITQLGALFQTENDGKSWSFLQDRVLVNEIFFHDLLAVGENERIVVGSAGLIAETSNAGNFWQEGSQGPVDRINAMSFVSPSLGFVHRIGGSSVGLHRSSDGGNSWQALGRQLQGGVAIDFLNESEGLVLSEINGPLVTRDAGLSWTNSPTNPFTSFDFRYHGIEMRSSDHWIIVGNRAHVRWTENAGQSWKGFSGAVGDDTHLDVEFFPGTDIGIVVGFQSALRSVDNGFNWEPLAALPGARDIHCLANGVAIAVGDGVFRSADFGVNWTQVATTDGEELHELDFADQRRGLAVGDAGLVLQTVDGGLSWSETLGTGQYLFHTAFRDGDTAFMAGENGALLRGELRTP